MLILQRKWRLSDVPVAEDEDDDLRSFEVPFGALADGVKARSQVRCKIYLGYTSNLISSGVRETIRFLVQHKMVTHRTHILMFRSTSS